MQRSDVFDIRPLSSSGVHRAKYIFLQSILVQLEHNSSYLHECCSHHMRIMAINLKREVQVLNVICILASIVMKFQSKITFY